MAAAAQAQHAGVHGMNPWLETLGRLIREHLLVPIKRNELVDVGGLRTGTGVHVL